MVCTSFTENMTKSTPTKRRSSKDFFADYFILVIQVVVYVLFTPFSRLFYRAKRMYRDDIDEIEDGVLLVANHVSHDHTLNSYQALNMQRCR